MQLDRVEHNPPAPNIAGLLLAGLLAFAIGPLGAPQAVAADSARKTPAAASPASVTHHRTTEIDGVKIFYREAGP